MDIPREDIERLYFYETAREQAANQYLLTPTNADNLTDWGKALLELAHFRQGNESINMLEEAVSKFEEALSIAPTRHDTLWNLGNAFTSQGLLTPEQEKASECFGKAAEAYQKALDQDPDNEMYKRSMEMTEKVPSIRAELQKHLQQAGMTSEGPSHSSPFGRMEGGTSAAARAARKKRDSDFKYDCIGWGVLVVVACVWIGLARSAVPQGPPSPAR
ncbi:hypothetical protein CBR_g74896 [Chara braunii]|uniref:Uncharacterized protein n=1 Tax=Chara braunii TaxID=69332 RepID=A0A388JJJ0_CHABU|nr:hypothetical protein CBR_g74896 [Chara braunii]|eukprot:GBG41730.1 hypothetical protein CBR_g74896 [Chara braunii]